MKYIKKFANNTEYEEYVATEHPLPNVSLTVAENDVHYEIKPHDYGNDYLTFVAREDGTFKFSSKSVNYSLDGGETWTSLASNTDSPTVTSGSKILWKATLTPSINGIGNFISSAKFDVEGNAMSLLYGDVFKEQISLSGKNNVFVGLFQNNTNVVNAENMVLPATTLSKDCYAAMFSGCTSLTTAPQLLATTLDDYCYSYMFARCTSLTTAPELLATTLSQKCYYGMFSGCTSLTVAPSSIGDSSTIMGVSACTNMFSGCTALTTAPELPATTLAEGCYSGMFNGCTSLTVVPSSIGDSSTTMATSACTNMFSYCRSLTTAPELPATTLADGCYGYMFNGCTSLTTAPELPATTLAYMCYSHMFNSCTSLTTAPELPATTLAYYCYQSMFENCSGLTTAPELSATTLVNDCYENMFSYCSSLTTAPELPATTLADNCYRGMFRGCTSLTVAPSSIGDSSTTMQASACTNMFNGCTSLTTAPELPAPRLNNNCYQNMFSGCTALTTAPSSVGSSSVTIATSACTDMFNGCTALTTAPELPAISLNRFSYYRMFCNCSSLSYIKCLATMIGANSCTNYWVSGVASNGTFVKAASMSSWPSGGDGIPNGWTVQDAT